MTPRSYPVVALALLSALVVLHLLRVGSPGVAGASELHPKGQPSLTLVAHDARLPGAFRQALGAANPHGPIRLDCATCHRPEAGWPLRDDSPFEHTRDAGFALDGRHALVACGGCHLDLVFTEPATATCATCHVDVHRAQLGPDCAACHTPVSFALVTPEGAHARTAFPLTGSHRLVSCESCHTGSADGRFVPLDPDCFACHAADYQRATPDHVAAGFPTDCAACHGTLAFGRAGGFEHAAASGGFRLLGAHATLACAACHAPPDFQPLFPATSDQDCVACHQNDHQRAHPTFPTLCADCHSVQTWQGATFDHDPLFPIYSGEHAGTWTSCQSCHVQPGAFAVFSCVTCHEHRRSEMDDEHEDVPSYVYESTACFACHPRGED